jgi:hypothetical protein
MRPSLILATLVTAAAATCSVLIAPAGPATAITNAADTISGLRSQGYQVNIDRIGSGPMDDCVVTSVRNPQTITRWIKDYHGPKDKFGRRPYRLIEIVVHRSISVSLDCTSRT